MPSIKIPAPITEAVPQAPMPPVCKELRRKANLTGSDPGRVMVATVAPLEGGEKTFAELRKQCFSSTPPPRKRLVTFKGISIQSAREDEFLVLGGPGPHPLLTRSEGVNLPTKASLHELCFDYF